jgi:hypothetical protein
MEFITGFIIGAVVLAIAAVIAARSSAPMRAKLEEFLLGGPRAKSSGVDDTALRELERHAPDLARTIVQQPAVRVDSVPAEIDQQMIEEIQSASTDEEADARVERLVVDRDVRRVIVALSRWRPRRRVRGEDLSEQGYEESFIRSLQQRGFGGDISQQETVYWSSDSKHGGGSRRAKPDIILKDRVLIELKGNMTKSAEADRAMGQVLRYLLAWKQKGPAVLAVCGDVAPEMAFLVRLYVKDWRETLNLPVTVFFKNAEVQPDSTEDLASMPA